MCCQNKGGKAMKRWHFYRGYEAEGENDVDAISDLFRQAGLDWNDYSADEAIDELGEEYAMAYIDLDRTPPRATWKPGVHGEAVQDAEDALRRRYPDIEIDSPTAS
jgi:hypothetical protein